MKNKKILILGLLITLLIPITVFAVQNIGIPVEKEISIDEYYKKLEEEKRAYIENQKSSKYLSMNKTEVPIDNELIELSKIKQEEAKNNDNKFAEIISRFYKEEYEKLSNKMKQNENKMSLNELYAQSYSQEFFKLVIDVIKNKNISNDEKDFLKEFLSIQYWFIGDDLPIKLEIENILNI